MNVLFPSSPEVLVFRFSLPHGWAEQPWWVNSPRLSLEPSDLVVYVPHDSSYSPEVLEGISNQLSEFVENLSSPFSLQDTSELSRVAGAEVWVFSPYSPGHFISRSGTRTPDSGLPAQVLGSLLGFDPLSHFTFSSNPAFEGIYPSVTSFETTPPTTLYVIPPGV